MYDSFFIADSYRALPLQDASYHDEQQLSTTSHDNATVYLDGTEPQKCKINMKMIIDS